MKKAVKIAGNILMIAAAVFVAKKLYDMDVSPSQFREPPVAAALALGFVVQTVVIVLGCVPWLKFVQALSGKRIPFSAAAPVYAQSNLYKYVPGNVFQYVGRNKLAADMSVSHVDVALATVMDVLFCVFWTGAVAVALLGGRIVSIMSEFGGKLVFAAIAGALLVAAAAFVIKLKFGDKVASYLSRYAKAFEKGRRKDLLQGFFYYLGQNIVSAATYFACLALVLGTGAGTAELSALAGAFMFAWIIGFATPGAPGGIGIREGVMLFVCGDSYADKIVLFVLVTRISSIFADLAAFAIGKLVKKAYGADSAANVEEASE